MFRPAAFAFLAVALLPAPAFAQSRAGCAVLYNAQEREIVASTRMADALRSLSPDVSFDRDANELTRRMVVANEQVVAARREYISALDRYAQNLRAYQRLLEECSTGPTR